MSKIISHDAAQAFIDGKKFKRGATQVTIIDDVVRLRLWGNTIAKRKLNGDVYNTKVTLAGYNTITTRERVNCLLDMLGANIAFLQGSFESKLIFKKEQKIIDVDCENWFTIDGDNLYSSDYV